MDLTMLMALGAVHGINPGMGWLFAVALGMQERRRGAVLRALVPLGVGHALAVACAIAVTLALGAVIPIGWLRWPLAGVLVGLGLLRTFRHRHARWAGMRVSLGRLTVWSFLMASAHGAGLMVVPLFIGMSRAGEGGHSHHMHSMSATTADTQIAVLVVGLHALAYLAVTAFIAMLVFEKLGVGILRRAWFNLDAVWAAALVATGILTLI
jgi:hypothetical protein